MADGKPPSDIDAPSATDVPEIFSDVEVFAAKAVAENRRLRKLIAARESALAQTTPEAAQQSQARRQLLEQIEGLEVEEAVTTRALGRAEARNQQLAERYVDIETEYNTLGSLFVATHQLHSTLDLDDVHRTLAEVAINLIGAEVLAVFGFDERRSRLVAKAAEGVRVNRLPAIELGRGTIGESVANGWIHSTDDAESSDLEHPVICIPFRRDHEPLGAVAIYKLLRQKLGLTPLDRELFDLLAGHAATAIYAARLYSESKRKLDTMQGFLELMRPAKPAAAEPSPAILTRDPAGSPARSNP